MSIETNNNSASSYDKELQFLSVYQDITGIKENEAYTYVIAECFLRPDFERFVPYILQLNFIKNGLLFFEIPLSRTIEIKRYGIVEFVTPRHKIRHEPELFTVLFNEKSHHNALKHIIENWFLYYDTIDIMMEDILECLITDSNNDPDRPLPEYEPTVELMRNFFTENNLIKHINTFQTKRKHLHHEVIFELVKIFDINGEYEIVSTYEFLSNFICDIDELVYYYNKYQDQIDINESYDNEYYINDLPVLCLRFDYFDSYLFLYEKGYRLKTLVDYQFIAIKLALKPDLLYTIDHLYETSSIGLLYPYRGESRFYNNLELTLAFITLFEYGGNIKPLNFNLLLEEVSRMDSHGQCTALPLLLFQDNCDAPLDNISFLVESYSMHLFFQNTMKTDKIVTWKFNFRTMIRFEFNMKRNYVWDETE